MRRKDFCEFESGTALLSAHVEVRRKMKVFISWSGETSKAVALALKKELNKLVRVQYFVSDSDIKSGQSWAKEIEKAIDTATYGIICATPESLESEWVLFEAGSLRSKKTRVCPYLIGMKTSDLTGPLKDLHARSASKEGTWKLAMDLAEISDEQIETGDLKEVFEDTTWPRLKESLEEAKSKALDGGDDEAIEQSSRSVEDMVREVLDTVRELHSREITGSEQSWKKIVEYAAGSETVRREKYIGRFAAAITYGLLSRRVSPTFASQENLSEALFRGLMERYSSNRTDWIVPVGTEFGGYLAAVTKKVGDLKGSTEKEVVAAIADEVWVDWIEDLRAAEYE